MSLILDKDVDLNLSKDKIVSILPDFNERMWFVTRNATVGIMDKHIYLNSGQVVEKAFSINNKNIVFIITNEALYALSYDGSAGVYDVGTEVGFTIHWKL